MDREWFLYMLLCRDDTLYTGVTTDMEKRLKTHNEGRGSRYVKSRLPLKMAVWWKCRADKSGMLKFEHRVKRLRRGEKLKVINNPVLLGLLLNDWDLGGEIRLTGHNQRVLISPEA